LAAAADITARRRSHRETSRFMTMMMPTCCKSQVSSLDFIKLQLFLLKDHWYSVAARNTPWQATRWFYQTIPVNGPFALTWQGTLRAHRTSAMMLMSLTITSWHNLFLRKIHTLPSSLPDTGTISPFSILSIMSCTALLTWNTPFWAYQSTFYILLCIPEIRLVDATKEVLDIEPRTQLL
jgi:hypothetical protein